MTLPHTVSREIRLRSRPVGLITADNFELVSTELPEPGVGQVQVKNLWMSVDPYMRVRMDDAPNYAPPYRIGEVMQGGAIGKVVASRAPGLRPGDLVSTMLGWREAFNAPADSLRKLETRGLPPQLFLGAAGMPGLTAYVGLVRIAALKPGDVVFVSGAAGAVGSMACQFAKLLGHVVIGSAGGPEKASFLRELGVDHVIDYKATPDIATALRDVARDGIDVYFDNVGGDHLEAALNAARPLARFALCGAISGYNGVADGSEIRGLRQAVTKQLRLEGYLVGSHTDLRPAFLEQLVQWFEAGRITTRETVEHGIENAPTAFMKLFTGGNVGKMLVKL